MNYDDQDDYEDYLTAPLIEEHKQVVKEYLERLGELIQEVVQLRATKELVNGRYEEARDKNHEWRRKYDDAVKKAVAESKAENESLKENYHKAVNSLTEARKIFSNATPKNAKVGECVWIVYPRYSARDEFVVFKSQKKAMEYATADKSQFADKMRVKKVVIL